ncbi:UNVERIFIED_CONTAM: hypothetical protein Slati_2755800 [Sesamum latifolium]|uniref:Uncharacterized protein n=1 Tax=Sesamum latifolium TaxID=2727402 RepID=A0AAW2VXF9_9LAMI
MKELDSFSYHRVKLSKTQSSWTDEELRKEFNIPYVFAIDNMGMLSDALGRMLCPLEHNNGYRECIEKALNRSQDFSLVPQ